MNETGKNEATVVPGLRVNSAWPVLDGLLTSKSNNRMIGAHVRHVAAGGTVGSLDALALIS